MERSIMDVSSVPNAPAHPCRLRHVEDHEGKPDVPTTFLCREIARTAVTCSLEPELGWGWVGLHDRILGRWWWKPHRLERQDGSNSTPTCVRRLSGRMLPPTEILETLSSGRVLPICARRHCPTSVEVKYSNCIILTSKTRTYPPLGTEAVGRPMGPGLALLGVSHSHGGLQRQCRFVRCRFWSLTWPAVRR